MEGDLEVIAGGQTGLIKLRADSLFVQKAPYPNPQTVDDSLQDLRREYAAYQRLPRHPRLLQLHPDSTPERLILPYLQNGCLHEFLRAPHHKPSDNFSPLGLWSIASPSVSSSQRLQFASDATEGLQILHDKNIVHGDINSWNFLVDDNFRLCIIDFSGSTIDGEAGSAFEGYRYCLPRPFDDRSTTRTDLFALGSLLYEIATSKAPYERCEDHEVVEYFKQGVFPQTEGILLGSIILGCWQGAYLSAKAVLENIGKQQCEFGND